MNGDATFNFLIFCKASVDMIRLGDNSIGGHNNQLAWSIMILKGGEGSITYDKGFTDMQEAAVMMLKIIN